ncbi:UDP-glucuronate 4-epimerase 6 [Linum perenne]
MDSPSSLPKSLDSSVPGFSILRKCGDDVLGLDNFKTYNDPSLKRSRQELLLKHKVFIVEGDLNIDSLLTKLLLKHKVLRRLVGFINLLEVAKTTIPQPAIVWPLSSSV